MHLICLECLHRYDLLQYVWLVDLVVIIGFYCVRYVKMVYFVKALSTKIFRPEYTIFSHQIWNTSVCSVSIHQLDI